MSKKSNKSISKISNYQLQLLVESFRELGVNVVLSLLILIVFENQVSPRIIFFAATILFSLLWYTGFIISQQVNHD